DGTVWFTDPDFQRTAAPGGQPKTRVYRVGTDGQVNVVDDSIANPNGIALSPDGRTLYVAGGGDQGVLRAYALDASGQPGERRDLASTEVPDGMAIDCLGNIYLTEHNRQRVRVLSPEGEALATIKVNANLTNAAFGGADRRTLYLTGAGAVWSIDLDVAGLPYCPALRPATHRPAAWQPCQAVRRPPSAARPRPGPAGRISRRPIPKR